jgi:hypothetical protein
LGADSKALRLKLKPVSQEELLDAIVRYWISIGSTFV